ncbi:NAD-dependent epimerase/dehydratase family protein [Rhizobium sp. CNPSo 3464]|uniref:NAD-dependent epimerase/dehydratase family protein n=1 Tax=Rhizobium sp. CNPSo 3464 TaxID=3021406 RepID=UPI00254DD849|nr:NAD-dependent epimerase/dehydratase family protein [Rhizobium sp. CNPSo 3464]MDK4743667.1 NAD-dependent epimerase/dehydratase family protein [Rhizobium sp. CNPSo 3464]
MIFIIGGAGRLGQAIRTRFEGSDTISLSRHVYEDWWKPNSGGQISKYFQPWAGTHSTLFVASGLLDPHASDTDLSRINYSLPVNIIENVTDLGIRVITFGTIMETLLSQGNAYVQSKVALSRYVSHAASNDRAVAHFRLHTLYGIGEPSPFMFLGQILNALRSRSPFEMTEGKQLREYHHFEDDAEAIYRFSTNWKPGIVELSHGQPVTLRNISTTLFSAFGAEALLKIGARPEPEEENYHTSFSKPDFAESMKFRDALPAIVKYMEQCLGGFRAEG